MATETGELVDSDGVDAESFCSACDNTGLETVEERRGLDLHDRVVPCRACRPDSFQDLDDDADYARHFGGDRDPDYDVPSYRERLVIAFGQQWLDDLEAA